MKLAIMQPYFVPYLGYWQLLNTVDRFVIYDDVNFIKRGWVNRNRILINGAPSYITIPLIQSSQNKLICDISLQASPIWRKKMIKSIENVYSKSPYFNDVMPMIEKLILFETGNLSDFLVHSINAISTFLSIETELVITSRVYQNNRLSGKDRIIDICRREGATTYINPQGGQALYDAESFQRENIDLRFIAMKPISYKQKSVEFVPYLSIIDVLMSIGVNGVMNHINEFELFNNSSGIALNERVGRV